MIDVKEYANWIGRKITVTCMDGDYVVGKWIDWTSELDNEPDPESITVRRFDGAPVEVYVHDIQTIELG